MSRLGRAALEPSVPLAELDAAGDAIVEVAALVALAYTSPRDAARLALSERARLFALHMAAYAAAIRAPDSDPPEWLRPYWSAALELVLAELERTELLERAAVPRRSPKR